MHIVRRRLKESFLFIMACDRIYCVSCASKFVAEAVWCLYGGDIGLCRGKDWVGMEGFVYCLLMDTGVSWRKVVLSLWYLQRWCVRCVDYEVGHGSGNEPSGLFRVEERRLMWTTTLALAWKVVEDYDEVPWMRRWSKVSGVPVKALVEREREWLGLMDWDLGEGVDVGTSDKHVLFLARPDEGGEGGGVGVWNVLWVDWQRQFGCEAEGEVRSRLA